MAVFSGRLVKELFRLSPTGALVSMTPRVGPAGLMPVVIGLGLSGYFLTHGLIGPGVLAAAIGLVVGAAHVALGRHEQRRRGLRRARYRAAYNEQLAEQPTSAHDLERP